jgi:hypothetical protein
VVLAYLGSVEVAVPASERAEDLRRGLAQQVLDVGRYVQRSPPTCQNLGLHQLAGADRLLVQGLVVVQVRRDLLRLPFLHRRLDDPALDVFATSTRIRHMVTAKAWPRCVWKAVVRRT